MSDYAVRLRSFEGEFRNHIEALQAAVGFIGGAAPNSGEVTSALMASVTGIDRAVAQLDTLSRGVDKTVALYDTAENQPTLRPVRAPLPTLDVPWMKVLHAVKDAVDVVGLPGDVGELTEKHGPRTLKELRKSLGRSRLVRRINKKLAPIAGAAVLAEELLKDRLKDTPLGRGATEVSRLAKRARLATRLRKAGIATLLRARRAQKALGKVRVLTKAGRWARGAGEVVNLPAVDILLLPVAYHGVYEAFDKGEGRTIAVIDATGATAAAAGAGMMLFATTAGVTVAGVAVAPALLIVGTVVGVGVVTYKYGPAVWHAGGRAVGWAGDKVSDAGGAVKDAVSDRAEAAKRRAEETLSEAARAAKRLKDKAADVDDKVKDKAKDIAKGAKDHTIDAAGSLVKKGWKKLW